MYRHLTLAVLVYGLIHAMLVTAAMASADCIQSCSDWSIVLGHCRGQFAPSLCRDHKTEQYHRGREVKKSRGLQVAHQTNITYASQFIQCLCDGSKDNANEMMGSEAMKNAAHTCTECVTTPSIIVEDLKTFMGICVIISENGTAAQATTWAPFGYSMVTFGEDGKARQAAPVGALV